MNLTNTQLLQAWSSFFEAAPLPMWVTSGGVAVFANAQAVRLFEAASTEELAGSGLLVSGPTFRTKNGLEFTASVVSWPIGDGYQFFQAMPHAHAVEQLERDILESIASSRPAREIFDAICKLAEYACDGLGKCGLLAVDEGDAETFCVLSAPNIHGLEGTRMRRESLDAEYRAPLRGPDEVLLGQLALWFGSGEAPPNLDERLETSVSLAAVALTREAHSRRIRYKQERLAAISKASPVGLYQCNSAGAWIYANERHALLTGLQMHQCSGEGWIESVHPDDRSIVLEVWREARATETEFRAEYRLRRPGEKTTWVMSQETPVGADGFVGTVIDISELKEALSAVAEGADRFQTLANNISQFCWMADADGWIFWYNDRWYEYSGTTFEEMQGWGWRKVHHPDHVDRVVEKLTRHWQTGEVWEDTFPLRGKDGAYRWFLSRALPIRNAEGRVLRWFGTNTDITEQRQLESALNRQNMLLQRSNEELSRFAFIASHDLQEPLRMILSYAQLIRRSAGNQFDEKSASHMDAIIEAAGRMSKLILDLLSYAQASSSSDTDEKPTAFDLNQAVAEAIHVLRSQIDEAGAKLTTSNLPMVRGRAPQIVRVLQNLISNALKYCRPGVPVEIDIRAEREGANWRVLVTDNGQGFEPEHSERIFEFLKRLHGREVSGSGIGLAICKTLIERNGGTIGAEGRPGQGATFWFRIPAV